MVSGAYRSFKAGLENADLMVKSFPNPGFTYARLLIATKDLANLQTTVIHNLYFLAKTWL